MSSGIFLIISVVCGYLYVNWLPMPPAISFYSVVMEFVLNPFMFFVSAVTFIIGIITNGIFIRKTYILLKQISKRKSNSYLVFMNILFFICAVAFFMNIALIPMVLFFSFAFLYGMMTSEKNT